MSPVTHQTVKLSKGKHATPHQGVCVMELSSMLAGEPFTDHPRAVSRVIAAFMRRYNDLLDDCRRQDLYAYAATAVGTASSPAVEQARIHGLTLWAEEMWGHRSRWSIAARVQRRALRRQCDRNLSALAYSAIRSIGPISDESHSAVLAMVDDLIEIGEAVSSPLETVPGQTSRVGLSTPTTAAVQTARATQVQADANE